MPKPFLVSLFVLLLHGACGDPSHTLGEGTEPSSSESNGPEEPGRVGVPEDSEAVGARTLGLKDLIAATGAADPSPVMERAIHIFDSFEPPPPPLEGDWLAEQSESGQTFDDFRISNARHSSSKPQKIYFVQVGPFDPRTGPELETLAAFAETYFQRSVELLPTLDLSETVTERVNPGTGKPQWLITDILDEERKLLPPDALCLLGFTQTDLYPSPDWNFAFGAATLQEKVGVFSFARFNPSFFGRAESPASPEAVMRRSLKVIVHEIGHMLGIQHCVYFRCVMAGSNSLEEIDRHPLHLCPVDLRKTLWSLGLDPLIRYQGLERHYRELGLADESAWVRKRIEEIQPGAPDRG